MIVSLRAPMPRGAPTTDCWIDPATDHPYPMSFVAYRRTREAEERPPSRHRMLAADVDHYAWRNRLGPSSPAVEVTLTVRPDAPLRIRRIIAEVLRAIRRGQPAGEAIRHVSRRFGLRHARAREFISTFIGLEVHSGDAT